MKKETEEEEGSRREAEVRRGVSPHSSPGRLVAGRKRDSGLYIRQARGARAPRRTTRKNGREEGGGGGESGREAGGDSSDRLWQQEPTNAGLPRAAATVTCHRLALSALVALTTSITPHHPASPLDATSAIHPALSPRLSPHPGGWGCLGWGPCAWNWDGGGEGKGVFR